MNARRVHLVSCLTLSLCHWATASSWGPNVDDGIVCLDLRTGKPRWEFFPDNLGDFALASDGEHIVLLQGDHWKYTNDPTPQRLKELRTSVVDWQTGLQVAGALPTSENLTIVSDWPRKRLITASGDWVVGDPGNDCAISIMKGTTTEPRWIISVDDILADLRVYGDIVLYSPYALRDRGQDRREIVAFDSLTNRQVWSHRNPTGLTMAGMGPEHLYVGTADGSHALDIATGTPVWKQALNVPGLHCRATEHGENVLVVCVRSSNMSHEEFLYCLDKSNGSIRWMYEPGGGRVNLELLTSGNSVCTRIAPTRLMRTWNRGVKGREKALAPDRYEAALRNVLSQKFQAKSEAKVELHLRAWHALGDRFALRFLRAAIEHFDGDPLQTVAESLAETFPPSRDHSALMTHLEQRFDQSPELRIEIGQILSEFDPTPYGYEQEKMGVIPEHRAPVAITPEKKALIARYMTLRGRADAVPTDEPTPHMIEARRRRLWMLDFEQLTTTHDASTKPEERVEVREVMFSRFPSEAAAWALPLLDEIERMEIQAWVTEERSAWGTKSSDRMLRNWLELAIPYVDFTRGGLPAKLKDPKLLVPISVRLLKAGAGESPTSDHTILTKAMGILARYGDPDHIPLIKPYLTSTTTAHGPPEHEGNVIYSMEDASKRHYVLRKTAMRALRSLGEPVPEVELVAPAETPEERKDMLVRAYGEAVVGDVKNIEFPDEQLEKSARPIVDAMQRAMRAEDTSIAEKKALELVALLTNDSGKVFSRDEWLAEAYRVLRDWDKAIDHTRRNLARLDGPQEWTDREVLEILVEANRLESIRDLVNAAVEDHTATRGSLFLIDSGSLDVPFVVLTKILAKNPNNVDACIGLALIHKNRGELDRADAMMDRAIRLRPGFGSDVGRTFTYWLDRKRPEIARVWVKTWLDLQDDRELNEQAIEWLESFPELKPAVDEWRAGRSGKTDTSEQPQAP